MIYKLRKDRADYGEAIGIVTIDATAPRIPGDVGNATTYPFPVRYKKVAGLTNKRALEKDLTAFDILFEAAKDLQSQGVRAITSECGFLGVHQKRLANHLRLPIFLSSLLQIPFITSLMGNDGKLGIITADSKSLDASTLKVMGVNSTTNLMIKGLENQESFSKSVLEESGVLDSEKLEREVVSVAKQLVSEDPTVKAILLECSVLPPYGAAVQEAVGLPVFDFVTMIHFVHSAVVKQGPAGAI